MSLALVAVNFAIFLYACYEYATSSRKEPWLRSTQVLLAGPGAVRPSVILLHGFGGTPRDLRSIAEPLAERGYRVVVPAIPEQTSTSFAYRRGRVAPAAYRAWVSDLVRDEAAIGGAPPLLVGTSMGGTLATIAATAPKNLLHVCFDNGAHASTGAQPTITDRVRLDEIARAAGYRLVIHVATREALAAEAARFLGAEGPAFLHVRIALGPPGPPGPRIPHTPIEMAARLRRALGASR